MWAGTIPDVRRSTAWWTCVAVTAAALGGSLVAANQTPAMLVLGIAGVGLILVRRVLRATWGFACLLGVLLAGYALLGRTLAYVGVPPLYIGDLLLLLGLVVAARYSRVLIGVVGRQPAAAFLLAFMAWGACLTIASLGAHGLDAIRDSVIWSYGLFVPVAYIAVVRLGSLSPVLSAYHAIAPLFLGWVVVSLVAPALAATMLAQAPLLNQVPFAMKAGDAAVHLAGVGAFVLLGLRASVDRRVRTWGWIRDIGYWILWLPGWVFAATASRGALLAVGAPFLSIVVLRPTRRMVYPLLTGALLAATVLPFAATIDRGAGRTVSLEQIALNLRGAFGESDYWLDGSRAWRLAWWGTIVNYTFFGDYFWVGKGFGVNLADDDNFQVLEDSALRSPHNGHMTVLARMGVPGFALWVLLQAAFGWSLVRTYWRARRRGLDNWARLDLWILAYWIAFLINAAADVYLEGPPGGIWFWSLLGFGLAALDQQSRELRAFSVRQSDEAPG